MLNPDLDSAWCGTTEDAVAIREGLATGILVTVNRERLFQLLKRYEDRQADIATLRSRLKALLDALKKYQSFAENNYADSDLHDADGSSWIVQGRAAIAQAEGE